MPRGARAQLQSDHEALGKANAGSISMLTHERDTLVRMLCREIHHIDDVIHERLLGELGWTVQEFEEGANPRIGDGSPERGAIAFGFDDPTDPDEYGWRWYAQEIRLRMFG